MNNYIQRMKNAISDYLGAANATDQKIKHGYEIYQPEAAQNEEKRLREELQKKRRTAEALIDAAYNEGSKAAREWGKLDGKKLTEDARLLEGAGVNPQQFSELVERYADNYTMLNRLRAYGEARNAEAQKESKGHLMAGPYNVHDIPAADSRLKPWEIAHKQAHNFLNIADGTGMDAFTYAFSRSTADKEFEAFGSDIQ